MQKFFITLAISLIASSFSFGQNVENNVLKVDFLAPGISYELGVSNNSTLYGNAMLGFSILWTNDESYYFIVPNLNFEYRYYYNYERRRKLAKETANNSANYIAPKITMAFPSIASNYEDNTIFGVATGAVYGLQRTYASGIYLNAEIGLAYASWNSTIIPIGAFKVGYVIGKN